MGGAPALGTARVRVCPGRKPCSKLAAYTGEDRVAYLVRKSLRTGWHYRALEVGGVTPVDEITQLGRAPDAPAVKNVTCGYFDRWPGREGVKSLTAIATLDPGWGRVFAD